MQQLRKLGNNEAKVAETLESGYFGILHSNPDFIEAEIADLVIDAEDVPESYFELQKRIARERGHGDIEFTEGVKDETIATLQDDQTESLIEWADYLRSEENGHIYPDWFKVYAWESLRKMGDFDKEKGEFKKRTKSTTAPWPELNAEALAYVYDAIDTSVIGGGPSEGRLQQLLKAGNFAKLYAHAITEVGVGGSPELREITKGSWVKYDQIEGKYTPYYTGVDGEYTDDKFVDNPTVIALTDSLRGMGTGWCTAGTRTAAHQLSMGDFYVYYTQDAEGNDTLPRIAIRMENGAVAEVRGIGPGQEVEPTMLDIVAEKLKMLPGGDEYFEKVENMKHLTEIDERVKAGGELTIDDIMFLRFSGRTEGFGWGIDDPRVSELLKDRILDDDLGIVLQAGVNPTDLANRLIDIGDRNVVANNLKAFFDAGADIDPTELANRLMGDYGGHHVANNLKAFFDAGADIDPTELANRLMGDYGGHHVANNLKAFLDAGADIDPTELANRLMGDYGGNHVANNLKAFLDAGAEVNPGELAMTLIREESAYSIANNLKAFFDAGVDPTALANILVWADCGHIAINNLDKFAAAGANLVELACTLINDDYDYSIANNLKAFLDAGVNPTELANRLIDDYSGYFVADNLGVFVDAGVNPAELASTFMDTGHGYFVASNLDKFVAAGVDRGYLEAILKTPE